MAPRRRSDYGCSSGGAAPVPWATIQGKRGRNAAGGNDSAARTHTHRQREVIRNFEALTNIQFRTVLKKLDLGLLRGCGLAAFATAMSCIAQATFLKHKAAHSRHGHQ